MHNSQHIFRFLLVFCLLLFAQIADAQLRRKASLGFSPRELSEEQANNLGMESPEGLYIHNVREGGSAEKMGLLAGDVLLMINDVYTNVFSDLFASSKLDQLKAGDEATILVWRNGKKKKLKGELVGKPLEQWANAETIYDQVPYDNGHLRTIVIRPGLEGKVPMIFFVPGYNCASYDNMSPIHPYRKLIDSLVQLGYGVFRVEKLGMGDSEGTRSCFDIDFETEQGGFEAGYKKMLEYDFVDLENIFVFGHSLGGINGPLVAEKFSPKGLIVYGTTHIAWGEYLMQMLRFQNYLMMDDYVEVEKELRTYEALLYEHYNEKVPIKEIVKNENYKTLLERDFMYQGDDMLLQRNENFWLQLHDLNLTKNWANVNSHVLSVYGEADFEALNAQSHQDIAKIVNRYHPGKGSFRLLEKTNHSMLKVGSMEDGVRVRNEGKMREYLADHFNYDFVTMMDEWIKSLNGK